SQSSTSSSVQILPAAFGWPANGQPPSPPTVESNWVTPILSPACALATASPRVSCRCRAIGVSGQRLRTSPSPRSMRIGIARPIVSAGEKIFDVGAGLLGDREPILQGRDDLTWCDVTLVVAAERRHHADPRHLAIVIA